MTKKEGTTMDSPVIQQPAAAEPIIDLWASAKAVDPEKEGKLVQKSKGGLVRWKSSEDGLAYRLQTKTPRIKGSNSGKRDGKERREEESKDVRENLESSENRSFRGGGGGGGGGWGGGGGGGGGVGWGGGGGGGGGVCGGGGGGGG